jgi:hypothetical protein
MLGIWRCVPPSYWAIWSNGHIYIRISFHSHVLLQHHIITCCTSSALQCCKHLLSCAYFCMLVPSWKNTIEMFFKILIWCKIVCPVLESAYKNECRKVISFYILIISTQSRILTLYVFGRTISDAILIVVFPCMLTITQLLFQQNALVY